MKFRRHHGRLVESMATLVEIDEVDKFIEHIRGIWDCETGEIMVKPYGYDGEPLPDDRIGWTDTWIVMVRGYPVGFTDGPPPDHEGRQPWRVR